MYTLSLAAACLMAAGNSSPASAQVWESDVCADSSIPAPYVKCVLHIDGDVVTRGAGGDVVMVGDAMRPVAISRMVRGGPARRIARRYEHAWTVGGKMQGIGVTLLFTTTVLQMTHVSPFRGPAPYYKTNKLMVGTAATGIGLIILSQPFKWRSIGIAREAIALSNASLTR